VTNSDVFCVRHRGEEPACRGAAAEVTWPFLRYTIEPTRPVVLVFTRLH